MIPEIELITIKSTADGINATTGKQMEKAFNKNFEVIKPLLESLFSIVSVQVSSDDITKLKVDTTTNPYSVYYTLDPLSEENPTWYLLSSTFASLSGSPNDNIALKEILDAKAPLSNVNTLATQVTTNTNNISSLLTDVSSLDEEVGALDATVAQIQQLTTDTIKTDGGVLYIRYNAQTNTVEYSRDKNTWTSILASNINFIDIDGNPADNTALVSYINNILTTTLTGLVTQQDLSTHTLDTNNPHQVTAAQLGLGTVLQDLTEIKQATYLHTEQDILAYVNDSNIDETRTYNISSHYTIEVEGDNT